jgi:hypothetical protein
LDFVLAADGGKRKIIVPSQWFVLAAGGGKHKMLGQACQHSFAAFLFRAGNHVVNSGHETKNFEPSQKNAARQDLEFVLAAGGGKRKIIVPSQWWILCLRPTAASTKCFDRGLSRKTLVSFCQAKECWHACPSILCLPPPAASTKSTIGWAR